MTIVITTPTGHIGHRVVEQLLAAKADVTVFVRNPDRLSDTVRSRARVATGDLEDAAALTRATKGAEALFSLVPPNYVAQDWGAWRRQLGRNAAQAITENHIPRVVMLSSFGAQRKDLGAISGVGEVEPLIQVAAPNVLTVRAGFFMENLLSSVPTLRESGTIYNALSPTVKLPLVATRDIGDVVAAWLLDPTWSGHQTIGVHGAADLSMTEAAAIIGEAIGRPVTYTQVPVEAAQDGMRQGGVSDSVAEGLGAMLRGLSTGPVGAEPRTAQTTTPTTLAEFARTLIRPAVLAPVGVAT
jgi:uncharacterized protein YbjT (DUF2867 family)